MMDRVSAPTGGAMESRIAPTMKLIVPARKVNGRVMTGNVFLNRGSVTVFRIAETNRMKRGIGANYVPVPVM